MKELEPQLTPPPVRSPFEAIYQLWPFWTMPEDIHRITNAMVISMYQHTVAAKPEKRVRKYTGLPFWTHPFRVAMRLANYPQVKLFWIGAALLHDTVEDTVYHSEEVYALKHRIISEVGDDTLRVVEELTNDKVVINGKRLPRRQQKEHDWRRLSEASQPTKIIKMLDRIDNLTEMLGADVNFKKLYLEESKELLKAIGHADKNIAWQLQTAIEFPYKWRKFAQVELEQKPKGMVFEHPKLGLGFVEEAGPGGFMRFADESWAYFNMCLDTERINQTFGSNPFESIIRETGDSVKTLTQLRELVK